MKRTISKKSARLIVLALIEAEDRGWIKIPDEELERMERRLGQFAERTVKESLRELLQYVDETVKEEKGWYS